MEGWTIFYMVVILKIPMVAALWLVWWAIKQEPVPEESPARTAALAASCRPCPAGRAAARPVVAPAARPLRARRSAAHA